MDDPQVPALSLDAATRAMQASTRVALDTFESIGDLHIKLGVIIANQTRAETDRQETNIRLKTLEKTVGDFGMTTASVVELKTALREQKTIVDGLVESRTRTAAVVGAMRWVVGGVSATVASILTALFTWWLTGNRPH